MKLFSGGYPRLRLDWIRAIAVTSELEILAGYAKGLIQRDAGIESILARAEPSMDQIIHSLEEEAAIGIKFLDKYAALLIINLFENWFLIDKPMEALESLVLDFDESPLLFVGDGMLPPGTAGIAEVHGEQKYDLAYFQTKVLRHNWLSRYVVDCLCHGVLRQTVL